jgi:NAD-dependent dihydropyrimidine dehydrogenase PreA subunit
MKREDMDGQRYLRNVVSLELDCEKCTGCGLCIAVCPHAVFEIEDRKVHIVDKDACMECGACGINCPTGAISVDSGVGCATAIIVGAIRGTEPTCDCSKETDKPSCCG